MTHPNKIVWCEEMDAALIEGRANGEHQSVTADRIGVSVRTLHARVKELGLPPKKRVSAPKPLKADRHVNELSFADLLASGCSAGEAGMRLGYAHGNSVLQRIRSKLGWQAV